MKARIIGLLLGVSVFLGVGIALSHASDEAAKQPTLMVTMLFQSYKSG